MSNLLQQRLNNEDSVATKKNKAPNFEFSEPKSVEVKPSVDLDSTPKNKKSRFSKLKKLENEKENIDLSDTDSFDEKFDAVSKIEDDIQEIKAKKRKHQYYFFKIFLCLSCAYFLFLIYGVMVTNYDYDEKGNVTAQTMTIDDIKAQKEFASLQGYYEQARGLYEKVLVLDYRLGQGDEDALTIAPEYEKLLDEDTTIIRQLEALSVSKTYAQTYHLLLTWVQTDISVYLQNISGAISQNNADMANEAILDKQTVYDDFYQTTANLISVGQKVKGADLNTIKRWSPEKYIENEIGK